jgi:mannose-1-phosphate guanylyltransferase
MVAPLERIAAAFGTPEFDAVFTAEYPTVENISIDYAVLEPRSAKGAAGNIYCLPADFGWNDLGSWAALHEHRMAEGGSHGHANIVESGHSLHLDAFGNYVYAPGKTVALLGVSDLIVVETDDAILITTRSQSQNVGRVVSELTKSGHTKLV